MATDVQKLRQDLIAATTDIRRKMTKKYQIEFRRRRGLVAFYNSGDDCIPAGTDT